MPTDAKRQAVTELADLLRASSALAVADYRGLTVSEMHTVRKSLRANGVSLQVAKNRLLKIAADEAGLDQLKPLLEGPTAIASTNGDEVSLARALQDAFRPYKVVSLRGGLLAGQPVSAADLGRLATLPSRDVLLGRLAGGMAAPLAGMAAVLAANIRNFVGVLNAVADQKRQAEVESPTAVAEPSERAEQTESPEPTDQADAEPTQPAEQTEPAEPTEPTESAKQVEEAEPTELGQSEQTDQAAQPEPTEQSESAEQTDQAQSEPAEQAAAAEQPESAEQTDQAEETEATNESPTDKENE